MKSVKKYPERSAEIFEITPNMFFRRADLVNRGQCNSSIILTDSFAALVDTPPSGEEIWDEVQELFGRPVEYVFLTHGHGDHTASLPYFLERNVTVYCSQRLSRELSFPHFQSTIVGVEGTLHMSFPSEIDLALSVLPYTAHSAGDMIVKYLPDNILCAGDLVVDYPFAFYHSADLQGWHHWLSTQRETDFKAIIPGHGAHVFPASYIREFEDFTKDLLLAGKELAGQLIAQNQGTDAFSFSMSSELMNRAVVAYFENDGELAQRLFQRANTEALRELRMVTWSFLRSALY